MTFEKIYQLLKTHRTVTLITADSAALIISFLYKVFKQEQDGFIANTIAEKDLIEKLSDYLYNLNRGTLYRILIIFFNPCLASFRIRFLDQGVSPISDVSDISIPLSEFSVFNCVCRKVLVTENLFTVEIKI